MKKHISRLPARLLIGIVIGILVGLFSHERVLSVIVPVKELLGEVIAFLVPLIIIGFVTPSVTHLGSRATRLLGFSLALSYLSSVLAALFSMGLGYAVIPVIQIPSVISELKQLPNNLLALTIDPVMGVMSALVFSLFIALAAVHAKAESVMRLADELREIVSRLVSHVLIPILPVFIACVFACLSYEGTLTRQLPVFFMAIIIVIAMESMWIAILYALAGVYARTNPLKLLRVYGPVYLTAIGTMSSAATLPVALRCVRRSESLRNDTIDFALPLFANIHLCGSVIAETFLVMLVHFLLKGSLPDVGTMLLFCVLLCVFAIAAPGVPGGTAMASIGMVSTLFPIGTDGCALLLALFALQDSFGTACNITSDGALTLILASFCKKHRLST